MICLSTVRPLIRANLWGKRALNGLHRTENIYIQIMRSEKEREREDGAAARHPAGPRGPTLCGARETARMYVVMIVVMINIGGTHARGHG